MKRSELKQLIREVVEEMAKKNPLLSLDIKQKHAVYTKKLQELEALIKTHFPNVDTYIEGGNEDIPEGEENNPDYDSDAAPSLSIRTDENSGYIKFLQDGKYTMWDEYEAIAVGNAQRMLSAIKKLSTSQY